MPTAFNPLAGDFKNVLNRCRGDAFRADPVSKGARQGVRRSGGKGGGDGQNLVRVVIKPLRFGHAKGQGAGLVEDHGIDFGQTLQRGAMLDQQALAEQFARGRGDHGGNRKAKRAGAGDDQDGGRDVDGIAHIATGGPHPIGKGAERQQVDQRRVKPRGAVGKAGIAGLRAFGDGDKVSHAVQAGILACGGDLHGQGAGQVDLARADDGACLRRDGQAFTGQKAAVNLGCAMGHDAVDRHPRAGADQHQIAHGDQSDGAFNFGAVVQHNGAGHFQRGKFLGS